MTQLVLDRETATCPQAENGAGRRRLRRLVLSRPLATGCLVVHVDHGIGRFEGIDMIEADGVPHACFRLVYAQGDRVFVPVENAGLLSYYGPGNGDDLLDRLGATAWEERKHAFHDKLLGMADDLVRTAAERGSLAIPPITPPADYAAFNARFPHALSADQRQAVADVESDFASGRLMDRLVCGDVGFGKTEVAMRAAFLAAMAGRQVAIIAPTTPLCSQHFADFTERMAGFPIEVVELSRRQSPKEAAAVKQALGSSAAGVVVGTHALLARGVRFADLGLLVIDEEQRFGVGQKEQLKSIARGVHVLTMTATPIPRTLQLALAGLRQVSVIATAPEGRKPVRTEALEFDGDRIREALLSERERGGQSFYVCPRLTDLKVVEARIRRMMPDVNLMVAHGRMKADALDAVMTGFVRRGGEVLLATNIIESGLNIPTANTLVVHRADMFGIAQLHQLRGRVGRSPEQGYVYLTTEPGKKISRDARQRLDYLSALQALGSGFDLASRDLDLRGAGTLFGEEQSGHLKDVGAEMFERMLAELVDALRTGRPFERPWVPRIQTNLPVFIPDAYVRDPQARVRLYRRFAEGESAAERQALIAELERDNGPLPAPVRHLAEMSELKAWCRRHDVVEVDMGPKAITMVYRDGKWPDRKRLEAFDRRRDDIDYRVGEKLIFRIDAATPDEQLAAARRFMGDVEQALG